MNIDLKMEETVSGVKPGLLICSEHHGDEDGIANVHRAAFGGEDELRLVAELRALDEFDPDLSLVAVEGAHIVGHILFTPVRIVGPGGEHDAMSLAPIAVIPERQRQGVGDRLVRGGLEACRRKGHKVVIVLGHPEYYPRFGFEPASRYGVTCRFNVPDDTFMLQYLDPNDRGRDIRGCVRYPKPFDAF